MPCNLIFLIPLAIFLILSAIIFFLVETGRAVLPGHAKDNKKDKRKARIFEVLGTFIFLLMIITIASIPTDANDGVSRRVQFLYHWCESQ